MFEQYIAPSMKISDIVVPWGKFVESLPAIFNDGCIANRCRDFTCESHVYIEVNERRQLAWSTRSIKKGSAF